MRRFLSQNDDEHSAKKVRSDTASSSSSTNTSNSLVESVDLTRSDSIPDVVNSTEKILLDSTYSILSTPELLQALNTSSSTSWITFNDVMYKFNNRVNRNSKQMIAFDMDGTLITTKSGKKFATDENDWKLWDPNIPGILHRLHEEGKYLAIISNQNGVKAGKTTASAVQNKVDGILAQINVPMDFICSFEDDKFRKPRTGMLEFLILSRCSEAIKSQSMYVGDAAGRVAEGTRGKDFSDTDLKMAVNLEIPFQTPEKFFLGSTQRLHNDCYVTDGIRLCDVPVAPPPDPVIFTIAPPSSNNSGSSSSSDSGKKQDIVLLVAPPACGKTTLSQKFIDNGYIRVNQDALKTVDRCIAAGRKSLLQGHSVCVDNTNMDPKARGKWVDLAKEFNIKARCVVLKTPKEVCRSLAAFRMVDPYTSPEDRRAIGSIVVNTYFKEPMKWPSLEEGFARIDSINWSPVLPTSIKSLRLFRMYLK